MPKRSPLPRLRGSAGELALAVGVQTLLALGLTVPHALAFRSAQEIRLKTAPLDPRDPLRGHYLTLNYAFSSATVPPEVKRGQTVYLPLRAGTANEWTGGSIQTQPPTAGLYLKGRVQSVFDRQARINYGIERFYLEEEEARAEDERRGQAGQKPLLARVQVTANGAARVVTIERDGVELK